MKSKKILPLLWHLAWSRDGLYGTWNRGTSSCVRRRVQNSAKSLSRSGPNVLQAIHERYSTPRLRDPMQLKMALSPLVTDIHEASRLVSYDQRRVDGQRPASPREPNHLNTKTIIVPSPSCVEGKPAVKPCSYRPSPSYVLSRLRVSLTPHSCVPLFHELLPRPL